MPTSHWVPWLDRDRHTWHASKWWTDDDGPRLVFFNIGFEAYKECKAYIDQADPAELTRLSKIMPAPTSLAKETDDPFYGGEPDRDDGPPDDDRFEWVEDQFLGEAQPRWIKSRCNHLTPAPVDLRTGELVAWWCPDCGEQFDRDRWPCPDDMWVPLPEVIRHSGRLAHDVVVLSSDHEYRGPCPHKHADWQRCAVCTAPDTLKPWPHGFIPYPRRGMGDPDYVITYQNPRMDDNGDLISWTTWAWNSMFLPVWNGAKEFVRGFGKSFQYTWPIWIATVAILLNIVSEGRN